MADGGEFMFSRPAASQLPERSLVGLIIVLGMMWGEAHETRDGWCFETFASYRLYTELREQQCHLTVVASGS